jgi:putative ABC transport system substrate-binding protein
MKRREFIAGLGGAAVWPMVAWAQQPDRMRRIGVLMPYDENETVAKARVSAFTQALADLGWTDDRNVRMDLRWASLDPNRMGVLAQELVGLQPDIIVVNSVPATAAIQRETRTIPIVFANVSDPVATGIVARLDRPSGNITGFGIVEASLGSKWLELLSEIAPGLMRVAIMFNPDTAPVSSFRSSLETAARSRKLVPIIAPVHSDVEIETTITALGREPGAGLVDVFTNNSGLMRYGAEVDVADQFRRAASYVDRIFKGEKPGDLPVQGPTSYRLGINLKTAKALGLTIPETLLAIADEVIQ